MRFPVNVTAVTVWEKQIVNRAPVYIRHELGASYWQAVSGQEAGNSARAPKDSVFLAVPPSSVTYLPKKDDKVLSGSVPDENPPVTALTVMQVKDFRFLLPTVMHVEVKAE